MALDTALERFTTPTAAQRRAQAEEVGRDAILVLARIGLGILMLWHVKVAWDYTGGVGGMVRGFDAMGIPFPEFAARFNLALEFFGGIALILGTGVRTIGLLMALNMAGAWHYVHTSGLYAMDGNGPELVIAIGLVSLMFAVTGPGRIAVASRRAVRRS
jgi:putative oxidoreductase